MIARTVKLEYPYCLKNYRLHFTIHVLYCGGSAAASCVGCSQQPVSLYFVLFLAYLINRDNLI